MRMKLLLTSDGLRNDEIIQALRDLVGRPFSDTSVAFIPTAAGLQEEDKSWMIDDLTRFRAQGFKAIDVVDIGYVPLDAILRRLSNAQVIAFGGGDSHHLIEAIEASGLADHLNDLLKERVYVGLSAGSHVAAPYLALDSRSSLFGDLGKGADPWRKALGIANLCFRPHLDSPDFPVSREHIIEEISKQIGLPCYAVDDESALKIIDGKVEVAGTGKVLAYNIDA